MTTNRDSARDARSRYALRTRLKNSRSYELLKMLGPRGENQEQLGSCRHGMMKGQLAQLFTKNGAAGLAGDDDLVAARPETLRKPLDMRALARAVYAFKGNESIVVHRLRIYFSTARLCALRSSENSVEPSPRATKKSAVDSAGRSAASIAALLGNAIGVGGKPLFT